MYISKKIIFSSLLSLIFISKNNYSQALTKNGQEFEILNTITTSVPFLMITPDSRASGMGDIGVATSPDVNSMHWNVSKLAFVEQDYGLSISYVPWLRNLGINDINLAYLTGFYKMNDRTTFGGSLRYFSLGNITFTDNTGNVIRDFKPNEFALDFGSAVQLSRNFSGGITARYIFSNLTGGTQVGGVTTKPANSFGVDLGMYFRSNEIQINDKDSRITAGMLISNIGPKVSYTSSVEKDFLPINMRLGAGLEMELNEYNKISFGLEFNKLLVPSPPLYDEVTGEIVAGRDPDVTVASGMFGSFTDAPGRYDFDNNESLGGVGQEEFREVNISGGIEYWYAEKFALRGGYFYEHPQKGNRRYFSIGAGLRYSVFELDLSYLIPTVNQHPLANTIRFSLNFNFDAASAE